MTRVSLLALVAVLMPSAVFAQAAKPAKPQQAAPAAKPEKPTPVAKPLIACPPQSQVACDSFIELWNAGDADVKADWDEFGMVCFRQGEDNFFVVVVANGYLDPDTMQRDAGGTVFVREWKNAYGRLESFKNGVSNADNTIPDSLTTFKGGWIAFGNVPENSLPSVKPKDATFIAKPDDNSGAYVNISATTAELSADYKNVAEKDVQYGLTIQLSTGRFVETHSLKNAVPTQAVGRCVPMPKSKN